MRYCRSLERGPVPPGQVGVLSVCAAAGARLRSGAGTGGAAAHAHDRAAMTAMAAAAIKHEAGPARDARRAFAGMFTRRCPSWRCVLLDDKRACALAALFVWLAFAVSRVAAMALRYFFGRAFGKHKLMPQGQPATRPSRARSGGLVGGVCRGAGDVWIQRHAWATTCPSGSSWGWGLAALGRDPGGDIVASYIKRICGVKDFGKIFPGHGGLLDRMDGIMYNSVALCIFVLLVTA